MRTKEKDKKPKGRSALTKAPEITSECDEGYCDLVFYIQEHRQLGDGTQVVRGVGTHKGRNVGLDVVLSRTWEAFSAHRLSPLMVAYGRIALRSIGSESDAFLQVLDELYGTKLHPGEMAAERDFTYVSLQGDPRDLAKGPVEIKLFYEAGTPDDYAEFYIDIDLASRRMVVVEKDEKYRRRIVRALTAT